MKTTIVCHKEKDAKRLAQELRKLNVPFQWVGSGRLQLIDENDFKKHEELIDGISDAYEIELEVE